MGDFNAHVGTDTDTWKGVIGKHGVTGLNEYQSSDSYLLYCRYLFIVALLQQRTSRILL